MYRRLNNGQNKKGQNPGNLILGEQESEGDLNMIGNEAVNGLNDLSRLLPNESNIAIGGLDDSLDHYAENDLNNYVLDTADENKPKEIPSEIIKEGPAGYYENDLNNLTLNKPKPVAIERMYKLSVQFFITYHRNIGYLVKYFKKPSEKVVYADFMLAFPY